MNNITIVGRLVDEPQIVEKDDIKHYIITLVVNRCYKNSEGIYENDFIPCIIWAGVANSFNDYCHKGDMVGIKGRLEMRDNSLKVIADKVTFLSSASKEIK